VAVHFIAVGKLLLGGQVVAAAVVRAQLHFEFAAISDSGWDNWSDVWISA
jgi:hypothetical protein